ncbi:unnamed protein product, partial [Hymenolepis diminuta]
MEMLDVRGSGQWTSLTFSSHSPVERLRIHSMARVGNKLFVKVYEPVSEITVKSAYFSIELNGDSKVSLLEAGPCSLLSIWWFLHL